MNRQKKMLIAFVLVFLMIMQCVLPVFKVAAADDNVSSKYVFNQQLYTALKSELQAQGAQATYVDEQRSIIISQNEIQKITKLTLSNFDIDDIKGLDLFSNVKRLDLSSNRLSKESHLEVLNSFDLDMLDLSSNQIEDVSMVTNIDSIPELNLHNQIFTAVKIVNINVAEDSDNDTEGDYELPQILKYAYPLISDWIVEIHSDVEGDTPTKAYVNWSHFDSEKIRIVIGEKTMDGYQLYKSMITLKIKITDPTNNLFNSEITVHYVVTDSDEQGIYIPDNNLYKAIKIQLTKDQEVNKDLISYYETDDEIRRNLYERAYDDAQVLVITVDDLINEISNLVLRDKKIKDMEGIQYFWGLSSNLDVTGNYIKSIEKFIELQHNQEEQEQKLRTRVSEQLQLISEIANKIVAERESIKANNKRVQEIDKNIATLRTKYNAETDAQKKAEFLQQINNLEEDKAKILEAIGNSENKLASYYPIFVKRMDKLYKIYKRIDYLTALGTNDIRTFDEEEDLKDLTKEQATSMVKAQIDRISNLESSEILTPFETQYLIAKYNIPTTKEVEVQKSVDDGTGTLTTVTTTEIVEIKNPIGTFFKEYVQEQFPDENLMYFVNWIREFRDDDFYMSLYNYCFIQRYFTGKDECVASEYAEKEALGYALDEYTIGPNDLNPYYWEVNPMEIIDLQASIKPYMQNCLDNYQSVLDDNGATCEGEVAHEFNELLFILGRQMVKHSNEISLYVNLPRLKVLNVSENLIEEIDDLEELSELRRFIAYDNEIVDISTIDWASLEHLRKLNLGFNEISDITPLEDATKLVFLCVSRNLLSGEFTFDLSKLEDLLYMDVSRNKLDSIKDLLAYLSFELRAANQNVPEIYQFQTIGDYMADPRYISVDLRGQQLSLKVENPVLQGTQMKVELPPIFAQSEDADPAGTSFSISSTFGNVTTDGKYAILDTSTLGTKQSVVYIDSRDSERDGLTEQTTCTILYKVVDTLNIGVEVTPETADVLKGGTQQFDCVVTGTSTDAVLWSVSGNTSVNTYISGEGLLTVAEDETAEQLVVKATSLYDEISSDTAVVNVVNKGVTKVTITPETATTIKGGQTTFTATVEGENLADEDKAVEFVVGYDDKGGTVTPSATTTFEQNGNDLVVTIGENETIQEFTIEAKSVKDANKKATATLKVDNKAIEGITISPVTVELEKGSTQEFNVSVLGEGLTDSEKEVTYTIAGNKSAKTKVYSDGTLVVGSDETAATITVTATSKADPSKKVVATVTIKGNTDEPENPEDPENPENPENPTQKVVNSVVITPASVELEKGDTQEFAVEVTGSNLSDSDKQVTYALAGNNSAKTKVLSDGTLVVGSDETATTLTVTATSKLDPNKKAVATVTVKSANPDHPQQDINLGYTVEGDYLVDVKTKTPVDAFKSKLAPGYKVVVTDEEGNTVSSGYVKTGMFAQVQDADGKVIKDKNGDLYVFEIAVKGDVNKDGLADSRDSNLIKAHRNEVYTLEGAAARAADIDNKNGIDAKDSKLLLYHRAEVTGYSLDYNG